MNTHTVTLEYQTENKFTPQELKELILEQWDQTGASIEGDVLIIKKVDNVEI